LTANATHLPDQRGGYSPPPPHLRDREIVDVYLAPSLLEFRQLVSQDPAHDFNPGDSSEDDDVRLAEQLAQVLVTRRRRGIMFVVDKGRIEHAIERANPGEVIRTEPANLEVQIVTAVPLTLTMSIEPLLPMTS